MFMSDDTVTICMTWDYQRHSLKEIVLFSSGNCRSEHACRMQVWTTNFNSDKKASVQNMGLYPNTVKNSMEIKGKR